MNSEQKVQIFVATDCFFQVFKSTFWPDFFVNIDFAMYSVQPIKICLKNVNFKVLKFEPKKFEFLSPPTVLAFLQT
jgi:hypothetical protein